MLPVDLRADSRTHGSYARIPWLALALAPACGDDAPMSPPSTMTEPPEVVDWRATEYVDIGLLSDDPLCAGTLAMIDDHVRYVLETLELELEDRITLYLWPSMATQLLSTWCVKTVDGCAVRTTVYSGLVAISHELVHAATASVGHGSWFVEGVANALGTGEVVGSAWQPVYRTIEATWPMGLGGSGHGALVAPGHFSRWLIERVGGATYMDLYRQIPFLPTREEVEAASRAVLGVGFDDLLREYNETAPYVYRGHWQCYVPPDAAESPWVDGFWDHQIRLDCDRTDTFTESSWIHGRRMTTRVPITIPADGRYMFITDHPDAEVALQPCPAEPIMKPIPDAERWPLHLLGEHGASWLRAGPHVLLVHLPPGAPADVRVLGFPSIQDTDVP